MKTNLIDDLRDYYLSHCKVLHKNIIHDKQTRSICDAYYISGYSYRYIAMKKGISLDIISRTMIKACSAMIRYRYGVDLDV